MMELSEEDREFLYGCLGDYLDANARMAEKYHMTIDQVRYKKKLIDHLRAK